VFTAEAADTSICVGAQAVLSADLTDPGVGAFDYSWDFGDASPPLVVPDPTAPVAHTYDAQATFQARLTAVSASDPFCNSTDALAIGVETGTEPTGNVGNRLRVFKQLGTDVRLDWSGSTVTPPDFNLHRTDLVTELESTAVGIGDEPILIRTTAENAVDPGAIAGLPPLGFYRVLASDSCGGSVLP
jgi:hypothetical protein